jgi:hypothetical protein
VHPLPTTNHLHHHHYHNIVRKPPITYSGPELNAKIKIKYKNISEGIGDGGVMATVLLFIGPTTKKNPHSMGIGMVA